jgi:SPOR domain
MTTKPNQPQEDKHKDFGLPQVEFKPIEAGIGAWLKITAIIVGFVLLIGAGFVYWFFYHAPAHDFSMEAQTMSDEQDDSGPKADVDATDDDESARHHAVDKHTETPTLVKELEVLEGEENTKDSGVSHAAKPARGAITSINTPRGCYYVVVGSFIDDDLASDYANRLAQQGVDVMCITPPRGQHYFRIAIQKADTFRDAHARATALKATYGKDIWVMKY